MSILRALRDYLISLAFVCSAAYLSNVVYTATASFIMPSKFGNGKVMQYTSSEAKMRISEAFPSRDLCCGLEDMVKKAHDKVFSSIAYSEDTGIDSVLINRRGLCFDFAWITYAILDNSGRDMSGLRVVNGFVDGQYHTWLEMKEDDSWKVFETTSTDGELIPGRYKGLSYYRKKDGKLTKGYFLKNIAFPAMSLFDDSMDELSDLSKPQKRMVFLALLLGLPAVITNPLRYRKRKI